MPGYRRKRTVHRLTFEDEPGLEIFMKPISIDDLIEVGELADGMQVADVKQARAAMELLYGAFIDRLEDWNLEEELEPKKEPDVWTPAPPDMEGFGRQDEAWRLKVVMGWVRSTTAAMAPLMMASTGQAPPTPGGTTADPVEAAIPMSPTSPETLDAASGM